MGRLKGDKQKEPPHGLARLALHHVALDFRRDPGRVVAPAHRWQQANNSADKPARGGQSGRGRGHSKGKVRCTDGLVKPTAPESRNQRPMYE